jgi:hypothetical protein
VRHRGVPTIRWRQGWGCRSSGCRARRWALVLPPWRLRLLPGRCRGSRACLAGRSLWAQACRPSSCLCQRKSSRRRGLAGSTPSQKSDSCCSGRLHMLPLLIHSCCFGVGLGPSSCRRDTRAAEGLAAGDSGCSLWWLVVCAGELQEGLRLIGAGCVPYVYAACSFRRTSGHRSEAAHLHVISKLVTRCLLPVLHVHMKTTLIMVIAGQQQPLETCWHPLAHTHTRGLPGPPGQPGIGISSTKEVPAAQNCCKKRWSCCTAYLGASELPHPRISHSSAARKNPGAGCDGGTTESSSSHLPTAHLPTHTRSTLAVCESTHPQESSRTAAPTHHKTPSSRSSAHISRLSLLHRAPAAVPRVLQQL